MPLAGFEPTIPASEIAALYLRHYPFLRVKKERLKWTSRTSVGDMVSAKVFVGFE